MTQDRALDILKTGANVFLTGEPGSGKTYTVNRYIEFLRDHGIEPSVTASTGIAATHVGGMTIHAWSGIGVKRVIGQYDLETMAEKERLVRRIVGAKVLIIDEVSMLDAVILDAVELVCRTLRRREEPFGGLQVVLVGDFFQLPPVTRAEDGAATFAYDAESWTEAGFLTCYLTEQHRQEDAEFLASLTRIRSGSAGEETLDVLSRRVGEHPDDEGPITRLYAHNANVDAENAEELERIPEESRVFMMTSSGNDYLIEALKKNCLSPERLVLKDGASVMFTKNDFDEGFVNGTLGTVSGFDDEGYPIVRTKDGDSIVARPAEWVIEDGGKTLAKVSQIPLRLAWAITIHKSQGMSLDAAVVDLSRTFEFGQGYVALSRVRSLDGLYLLGIQERALMVHPDVLAKDARLREASLEADRQFGLLPKTDLEALWKGSVLSKNGRWKVEKKAVKRTQRRKGSEEESGLERTPYLERLAKVRERHPNAYRAWTKKEDEALRVAYERGEAQKALSERFGRQRGAIRSRLLRLGLIQE